MKEHKGLNDQDKNIIEQLKCDLEAYEEIIRDEKSWSEASVSELRRILSLLIPDMDPKETYIYYREMHKVLIQK